MKAIRFIILLCVAAISGALCAQSQKELGQLMHERNEYYFTLSVDNPAEIQAINSLCSVDGTDGRTVVAYANQQQYDQLIQAGYQPNLQTPPSLREEAKMWDGNRATYDWDSYPTYSQYQSMMEGFPATAISGRSCTYMELGTLSSGRKIMGVRINNGSPEGKPKFLYSSTIHGDETTGWILMLRLIDMLCTSTDSRIVNLVNNLDIFIFPNTNPDGTYYGGNNTVTGARRANANGVDMNRNYPDPHSSAHPDGNAYQTETQWFMQLAENYPFVMAANFHGGAEVVNYPWDNTSTRHADDAWWQYVSREYANSAQNMSANYMTDQNNGITNGADWYTIGGGRQDYMNGYRQCRELTIECSTTKNPSASTLPQYWKYNNESMLAYMEQCLNGVHGFVYDATTNQPIEGVTVTVLNHDDNYSKVSTHEAGDFHRPIKGGSYTFKFSKSGYNDQTVNVTVADDQRLDIEVSLTAGGTTPTVAMNCYEQTMPSADGSYVMGYLEGTTLKLPTNNNSSTLTITAATVTPTDNGISVEEENALPQVTLTAYGSNGQYYISYNGRYLTRSSSWGGSSLTWGTSQNSASSRWYINDNGIYVTSTNVWGNSSTNYYLYFDSSTNSFKTSSSAQSNIAFFAECDCPTPSEPVPTYGPDYPWIPTTAFADNMSVTAQIQINGVPVTNPNWEVGAFCGEDCRGDAKDDNMYTVAGHPEMGYFMDVLVWGATGDVIDFYLYDQEAQSIFPGVCHATVNWELDGETGDIDEPFILNFVTEQTFTKEIAAYTENGGYYLIASPIGEVNPEEVTNMLENDFDLYYFDQESNSEWINYESNDDGFNLVSGKGYLYANSEDVTLTFTGTPYNGDGQVVLAKTDNAQFGGWNLVGNPFAQTAYITKSFYTLNADGSEVIASTRNSVEPMEGIFVIAEADGETMTFSTEAPSKGHQQIVLNITQKHNTVSGSATNIIDRAIVRFDKGGLLPKFSLNHNNTKFYIPQGNNEYAVVCADANMGELPVNFKAAENDTYTMSFNADEISFSYLHLIDNLNGNDVDLLVHPSYTFEAKTTDYASRFKLVFATGVEDDSETFAFFSNGQWIINNDNNATLQVVDVTGRILRSELIEGCYSMNLKSVPGVYTFRLIKGNDIKVQKVVVR